MLKVRAGDLIVLGLSERNVELLRQGRPIAFDGKDVGLPGVRFGICWGLTGEAIADDLLDVDLLPR